MSKRGFGLLLLLALVLCLTLAGPAAVLAAEHGETASSETASSEAASSETASGSHEGTAVAGSHEAGGHEAEASHGVTPAKLKDLRYRLQAFIAAVIILFFILRKPLKQFFSNRRQEIEDTLNGLEEKKAAAEARIRELEAKMADIQSEREAILADYVRQGEAEKAKIVEQAQTMAARIQQQAEVAVRQEIDKAKQDLKREIAEMAASMAEDLVRQSINAQDQERLAAEYLDKVVQS